MSEHDAAVTFDVDAFRAWLDYRNEPAVDGSVTNRQVSPLLSSAYQRLDGDGGWLVETTLDMLTGAAAAALPPEVRAWRYDAGVAGVRVWATAMAEGGADGGVAGEVTVDGTALSLGHLADADLVPGGHDVLPGYEAAELALAALAGRASHVAARFRASRGGLAVVGEVVDAEVVCDDGVPYSAYRVAAEAVDGDYCHPAHPAHW